MKTYEITFRTSNWNEEDEKGYWYNYYIVETEEEAWNKWFEDIDAMKGSIDWYHPIALRVLRERRLRI